MRPHRERFLPYALRGARAGARGVLVGSRHTAESLWEVLADEPGCRERTRLGPPGVDVAHLRARAPAEPASGSPSSRPARAATRRPGAGRPAPPTRCARSTRASDRIVSYVGKLIVSKGVDLLLAAWPLVVARVPDARLVIVGFGTYREALGRLRRGAAATRPRRRCARSRRAGASSRAARPAS